MAAGEMLDQRGLSFKLGEKKGLVRRWTQPEHAEVWGVNWAF